MQDSPYEPPVDPRSENIAVSRSHDAELRMAEMRENHRREMENALGRIAQLEGEVHELKDALAKARILVE